MSLGSLRMSFAIAVAAIVVEAAIACSPDDGFQCGVRSPTDPSQIRLCARPNEVCVCATNSCAVRDTNFPFPQTDGGPDEKTLRRFTQRTGCPALTKDGVGGLSTADGGNIEAIPAGEYACPSGLRYVDSPFARSDLAGCCVPEYHVRSTDADFTRVIQPGKIEECPAAGVSFDVIRPHTPHRGVVDAALVSDAPFSRQDGSDRDAVPDSGPVIHRDASIDRPPPPEGGLSPEGGPSPGVDGGALPEAAAPSSRGDQ